MHPLHYSSCMGSYTSKASSSIAHNYHYINKLFKSVIFPGSCIALHRYPICENNVELILNRFGSYLIFDYFSKLTYIQTMAHFKAVNKLMKTLNNHNYACRNT